MSRNQYNIGLSAGACVALAVGILIAAAGCPRASPTVTTPLPPPGVPDVRVLIANGNQATVATTGGYRLLIDGRLAVSSLDPLPEGALTRSGKTWAIHQARYPGDTFAIEGIGQSVLRLNGTTYRGRIVCYGDALGGIIAVNHVDVESYLAGVLRRELLPHWHIEAYKAQAIAARTYALYEKAIFGGGRLYDLRDDQSSQVYGGLSAETDKTWKAVRETGGIVLTAGPAGKERIFRAHYSSCCGGVTNNVYVLYGPPVEGGPLAGGVVCTDCRGSSRYRWPAVSVDKGAIYTALAAAYPAAGGLGGVRTIQTVAPSGDRPVWIDALGTNGASVRVRADDLRLALLRGGSPAARGLSSMNCTIRDTGTTITFADGRGFGHGVGLCQWGAQRKAEKGYTALDILNAYYPGAKLFRAY